MVGSIHTETTSSGQREVLFLPSTVPIIAVRRVRNLPSSGLVHKVEGIILGTAIAVIAHRFAADEASAALILAAVRMANSSLLYASCFAPWLSVVTTSPTNFCVRTTGGKWPSKDQRAMISRSLLEQAESVIFSGCVICPASPSNRKILLRATWSWGGGPCCDRSSMTADPLTPEQNGLSSEIVTIQIKLLQ